MSSLVVTTPPTVEPITLDEAKAQIRVDITDDDNFISGLISSARANLERVYDVAMMTQTLTLGHDYFPNVFGMGWGWAPGWWLGSTWMAQYDLQELRYGYIRLARSPVQSISAVNYIDGNGNNQTWPSSNYVLDGASRPGRLSLAYGQTFPTTAPVLGAVKVTYVAGYSDPSQVPGDWKQALAMYIGHLYQNREQVLTGTRLVALEMPLGVPELMAPDAPTMVY